MIVTEENMNYSTCVSTAWKLYSYIYINNNYYTNTACTVFLLPIKTRKSNCTCNYMSACICHGINYSNMRTKGHTDLWLNNQAYVSKKHPTQYFTLHFLSVGNKKDDFQGIIIIWILYTQTRNFNKCNALKKKQKNFVAKNCSTFSTGQ